jgi:hypothetical protein
MSRSAPRRRRDVQREIDEVRGEARVVSSFGIGPIA